MIEILDSIFKPAIIIVGIFLFIFFLKNRKSRSNYWMAWMNLTISIHFINLFLLDLIHISHFGMVFGLMYGPLIYFFVSSYLNESNGRSWIHFGPASILLSWILAGEYLGLPTTLMELTILQFGVFIHIGLYLFLAFNASNQYQNIAYQTRSQLNNDKIKLLQHTILIIGVLFLISVIQSYTEIENFEEINKFLKLAISLFILLGMLGIIYQGMDKPHIYSTITSHEKRLADQIHQYAASGLTDEKGKEYLDHLIQFMKIKKAYKQENISIDKLAEMTNIPARYLSQIINQKLNQNFFDFINSHRIEDAQEQLKSPGVRVSEVMYEVGFSSRSSFNTAFKKYTSMTPSQYRNSLKTD